MELQNILSDVEKAVQALYFVDFDAVREAIRAELMAEVRDEIREELVQEIREELESAVDAANEDDAPEIGTSAAWGKDDAAGLGAWLTTFNETW